MTGWVDLPTAPPTLSTLLAWDPQPLPVLPALGIVLVLWYSWALTRLRARGRRWPWPRTASFLSGCALLVATTALGVEGYGYQLFSAWMFQHLTLSMAVPPLLVLGAPGLLLLRTTAHHGPGRIVLITALSALRSRGARILLHPAVTIALFLFSYYGIYLSPVFDATAGTAVGHIGLEVFFLLTGLLFIVPILSIGPLPGRPSYLGRFFDLFVEMPLHVFFGVILMMASTPLVATFATSPPEWGIDPLDDQEWAGALAWSYGEPVALLVVVLFAVRWYRSEQRTAAAEDRYGRVEAERERAAYNAYLRSLPSR